MLPALAVVALAAGGAASEPPARPPEQGGPPAIYVDRGACPFEGCAYRTWTARADVPLYDRPGGAATGVVVKNGEEVEAITGEVHVRPLRVTVRRKIELHGLPTLRPGDAYYLLTYVGEGTYRIWLRGRILELEPDFGWEGRDACDASPAGCASVPEGGRDAFLRWTRDGAVWWVSLRTRSGAVGWTREPDGFDGKDVLGKVSPDEPGGPAVAER